MLFDLREKRKLGSFTRQPIQTQSIILRFKLLIGKSFLPRDGMGHEGKQAFNHYFVG